MDTQHAPVVIIGSGIAGLLTALKLAEAGIAAIVATKTCLTENSSWMAQGGIAAVLPENGHDSLQLHLKDTLYAGAGLTDEAVARSILSEGYLAIEDLIALGVPFDRVNGKLVFAKEAAHTTQRILHAGGDATGRSIQDTLIHAVKQHPLITLLEEWIAVKLLVAKNRCYGVEGVSYRSGQALKPMHLWGDRIVLATGGIGQLYSQTTNPAIATGDGIALAAMAGARIQDMEFVQFHPTAFWYQGQVRFLISEALRGEGGILRDAQGQAFAREMHPEGELAPRDVLTRAIWAQLEKDKAPCVWLDMTHIHADILEQRFPTILQSCLHYGVDIRTDRIPVAPAAHYGMGGVWVDTQGRTTLEGLSAVGEVVSTGLHGANRLASNSLLECVVLARRVAQDVQTHSTPLKLSEKAVAPHTTYTAQNPQEITAMMTQLKLLMWRSVGVLRQGEALLKAQTELETMTHYAQQQGWFQCVPLGVTLRNMLLTARLITQGALSRQESRGAHNRMDYANLSPQIVHTQNRLTPLQDAEVLVAC